MPTAFLVVCLCVSQSNAASVLIEAESFQDHGGWSLDTEFIQQMGSPYLLAHALGKPGRDATTRVKVPAAGRYYAFVRTKDWVAPWKAKGQPGRFQVLVQGQALAETLGTEGAEWHWQAAGVVELPAGEISLALHDLTGFDGRCDAIYFCTDNEPPPNDADVLPAWRRERLRLPEEPTPCEGYDLVVVGGGYAGMGSAIAAARAGCKVALIQDRPVLGGNGSSEVRVWAQGNIRRGKFPRIGEIIEEFADRATASPGKFEEFGDAKKEALVLAEPNIDLFLNHHAYQVDTQDQEITAVYAFDTRTSERKRFAGRLYADCTGHATLGFLAHADWDMEEKGRMGMSNMWTWAEAEAAVPFPQTPWALPLTMKDFPYPRDYHGEWFWESGFDKDPLQDAELIRDWNLRAVFGAFNAMKNGDGADKHSQAYLTWVAFVGGPRESRRLMGDVILTQDDIVSKRDFPDGCVPSTWSIDLHYPKKQFAAKFPDNPFISIAENDQRIDRTYGYPIPYRCFYSRNVNNLFMAGRCISVTHEALGTTRVMKTCGMMGEVVGKAASVCTLHGCLPRDVFERYWTDLESQLRLPGKAHRATVHEEFEIPADALPEAPSRGPYTGLDPNKIPGVVVDDEAAEKTGQWTEGTGLKGYVGYGYLYAPADSGATCRFEFQSTEAQRVEIRLAHQPHENRGTRVPVSVEAGGKTTEIRVNMRAKPPSEGFSSIGQFSVAAGETISVTVGTTDARGIVHADAIQVLPVP